MCDLENNAIFGMMKGAGYQSTSSYPVHRRNFDATIVGDGKGSPRICGSAKPGLPAQKIVVLTIPDGNDVKSAT